MEKKKKPAADIPFNYIAGRILLFYFILFVLLFT